MNETTIKLGENISGYNNIKNLQEKLNELIDLEYDIINLDLTESDSVDSAALTQILLYKKLFARKNCLLRIKGCSEKIYQLLKIIKLDNSISIVKE